MQLLHTIVIKNYPRKILASKAVRAKYYKPSDKLAKKYLTDRLDWLTPNPDNVPEGKNKDGIVMYLRPAFIWRKVGNKYRLHDVTTKQDIVKNPSKAGQENWIIIKGQDIFSQAIHEGTRMKIVKTLKSFWKQELDARVISPIDSKYYPLSLHYHFNAVVEDSNDADNYGLPYYKTFQDSLKDAGIIKNDRIKEINGFKVTIDPINSDISNWGQSAEDVLTVKIYTNANTIP